MGTANSIDFTEVTLNAMHSGWSDYYWDFYINEYSYTVIFRISLELDFLGGFYLNGCLNRKGRLFDELQYA